MIFHFTNTIIFKNNAKFKGKGKLIMKRILIIFSVILITILPLKMTTDNIYKNQVKTNKFSKIILNCKL